MDNGCGANYISSCYFYQMKVFYLFTNGKNGGFGILGKGIQKMFEKSRYFDLVGVGVDEVPQEEPDLIFTYGTPDLFDVVRELRKEKKWNNFKHAHYFVWESSKIPSEFVSQFFSADLLITAAEYTQKAAKYAGLKNTKVWHHAVDARFKYIEKDFETGTFTFLHHNGYEYRKGTEFVIEAFAKEFYLDEDVRLIIKARERKQSILLSPKISPYTPEQLELKRTNPAEFRKQYLTLQHPQIEEIIGHVTDEEMVAINEMAHCFVFPAKGEGWGLPPFECLAMGIVPIMPAYSCFSEWFDKRYMLEVKEYGYTNTEPRYTGYMYHPSIKSLRKQMRWAFEHRKELKQMGKEGSKHIHDNYNWKKIHDELVEIVDNYKWPRKKRTRY